MWLVKLKQEGKINKFFKWCCTLKWYQYNNEKLLAIKTETVNYLTNFTTETYEDIMAIDLLYWLSTFLWQNYIFLRTLNLDKTGFKVRETSSKEIIKNSLGSFCSTSGRAHTVRAKLLRMRFQILPGTGLLLFFLLPKYSCIHNSGPSWRCSTSDFSIKIC